MQPSSRFIPSEAGDALLEQPVWYHRVDVHDRPWWQRALARIGVDVCADVAPHYDATAAAAGSYIFVYNDSESTMEGVTKWLQRSFDLDALNAAATMIGSTATVMESSARSNRRRLSAAWTTLAASQPTSASTSSCSHASRPRSSSIHLDQVVPSAGVCNAEKPTDMSKRHPRTWFGWFGGSMRRKRAG